MASDTSVLKTISRRQDILSAAPLATSRSSPRRWGRPMINGSMIFRQVSHDLFGSKDVQDASTLTYTWLADQFGHITLGFIVTLLLSVLLSVVWSAILVAVAITAKEAYDYVCELHRRQGAFPFNHTDVLLNCATSCIYTWIGAVLAVLAERVPKWSLSRRAGAGDLFGAGGGVLAAAQDCTAAVGRAVSVQTCKLPAKLRRPIWAHHYHQSRCTVRAAVSTCCVDRRFELRQDQPRRRNGHGVRLPCRVMPLYLTGEAVANGFFARAGNDGANGPAPGHHIPGRPDHLAAQRRGIADC